MHCAHTCIRWIWNDTVKLFNSKQHHVKVTDDGLSSLQSHVKHYSSTPLSTESTSPKFSFNVWDAIVPKSNHTTRLCTIVSRSSIFFYFWRVRHRDYINDAHRAHGAETASSPPNFETAIFLECTVQLVVVWQLSFFVTFIYLLLSQDLACKRF